MRRSRIRRRRALATLLLPVLALTISSATSTAADREAAINPAKKSVRIGDAVKLRGHFPGSPGATVQILHRAAGKNLRRVATTRTGADARWKKRVKPRSTGTWRARLAPVAEDAEPDPSLLESPVDRAAADRETNAKRIRVRSKTRVRAAKRHAVAGDKVRIRGRVMPAGKRRVVVRLGGKKKTTRTNRRGRFSAKWRPGSAGTYRVKARARGNRVATSSRDQGGRVTVYRRASASWYGPGLYGNRTACGQTLSPGTVGVAHKTMPCGTKLKLRHSGNTVKVKVIDRGPFVHGREFDLTAATKNKLGFGSTGTVLSSK